MAINRITQVTGETQSTTEWISTITSFAGGLGFPTLSSVKARTGTYSWLTQRQIGIAMPDVDAFRSNYMFNHMGATGSYLWIVHRRASAPYNIVVFNNAGSDQLELYVEGNLVDTVSSPTSGITQTDTWLAIGLYVESGTPGKVVFYIDGLEQMRYDGNLDGNFDYVLSAGAATSGLIPSGWSSGYLDDWYVDELTDTDLDEGSPPSPGFMATAPANETFVEWTPVGDDSNIDCVDDGAPDNDSTYVMTEVSGQIDRYGINPITLPENFHIVNVIPYAVAKKTDAESSIQLEFLAFDGLNTDYSDPVQLPTGYRVRYGYLPLQPDSSEWTENDFNAMHFGFRSAGSF